MSGLLCGTFFASSLYEVLLLEVPILWVEKPSLLTHMLLGSAVMQGYKKPESSN